MRLFRRWDEWVPVARLLKFNETNVALQKALSSQASQAASSSAVGSKKGAGGAGSGGVGTGTGTGRGGRKDGRGTKRGREEVSRLDFYRMLERVGRVRSTCRIRCRT
jgi:hypothetical protein